MKPDYKLLKPLPGIPEGTIYMWDEEEHLYVPCSVSFPMCFAEPFVEKHSDWFKKMPERIELLWTSYKGDPVGVSIQGRSIKHEERIIMEQALNGELYSIEELEELINEYRTYGNIFAFGFIQWLKQRNK